MGYTGQPPLTKETRIAALLDGSIPFLIVIGIIAATLAVAARAGDRRSLRFPRCMTWASISAFALAGLAFVVAVLIRSAGSIPT